MMATSNHCDLETIGRMDILLESDPSSATSQTLNSAIDATATELQTGMNADATGVDNTALKEVSGQQEESEVKSATVTSTRKRKSAKARQLEVEPAKEESKKRKYSRRNCKRGRPDRSDNCDVCGRMFTSEEALHTHRDVEHAGWKEPLDRLVSTPGTKVFPCAQCNNAYKYSSALNMHKLNHTRYPYTCNFCGTGVSRQKTLEQHQVEHTKTFQCDKCGKLFSSSNPLRKHKRDWCRGEANKRYDFHCPVCSYIFSSSAEQKKHIKAEHLNYVSCEKCGMDFNDISEFDRHVCYESTNHKYWCDTCPRRFVTYSKLMSHIQLTHNKLEATESNETNMFVPETARPSPNTYASLLSLVRKNNPKTKKGRYVNPMGYKCNDCPKVFKDRGAFHNHLRYHAKDKSFTCMICLKTLSSRASLFCHVRIHRGERPFVCEVCGKKFTEKSKLTRHKRIHTGEKPYICDKCGQSFNQPSSLKTHLRTHDHDNTANFCDLCKKSFRTMTAFDKHKCSQAAEPAPPEAVPKPQELDLVAQAALASDALDVLDGDSYDSGPQQQLAMAAALPAPQEQPPQPLPPPQPEVVQQQVVVTIPSHLSQTVSQTVSQAVWGLVSGAALGSVAQAFPQYDAQQLTSTLGEFVMQRLSQRLSRMAAEELPRLMTEALEELLP